MRIIPAIDIINGKCVRLSQGDYTQQKIYNESPLEVAKSFEGVGIKYLHLVDLDGAKSNQIVNWKVLQQIATKTSLAIDFGGGIKSTKSVEIAFENGAQQITGGSVAVTNPELFQSWLNEYGASKIILGADAKNEKVAINGWKEDSGEDLIQFISSYQQKGVKKVICTDIAKDGMLAGTATGLYAKLISTFPNLDFIASGGITRVAELDALHRLGCEGAILGKAIYESRITLKELALYVD